MERNLMTFIKHYTVIPGLVFAVTACMTLSALAGDVNLQPLPDKMLKPAEQNGVKEASLSPIAQPQRPSAPLPLEKRKVDYKTGAILGEKPPQLKGQVKEDAPLPVSEEKAPAEAAPTATTNTTPSPDIPEKTLSLVVPADTILSIALISAVSTESNKLGDAVKAVVKEPIFLGPYLAIPSGSNITGKITHIQAHEKDYRHPYIVVEFDTIKRPLEEETYAFRGFLIAYKTGRRGQDYVWRLPEKGDQRVSNLKGAMGGAISGAFVNPIFGPLVGAGVGFMRSAMMDRYARKGPLSLKASQPIPITVQEAFAIPVKDPPEAEVKPKENKADPGQPK